MPGLPSADQIRQAAAVFLSLAYPAGPPDAVRRLIPPEGFDPADWLMSERVERDPPDAALGAVRSFAIRLGNSAYPHMKLRLSRPPADPDYLFLVDSHDGFLTAPPDSADRPALEQLKRHNAALAETIASAWTQAGLPTERNYLRRKIRQARERKGRS